VYTAETLGDATETISRDSLIHVGEPVSFDVEYRCLSLFVALRRSARIFDSARRSKVILHLLVIRNLNWMLQATSQLRFLIAPTYYVQVHSCWMLA